MNPCSGPPRHRYCGRDFSPKEIEQIRNRIAASPQPNRVELSRLVCQEFGWVRPDGRLKEMSCRVALLRMERDGLLRLPPPKTRNGNGRTRPRLTSASDPRCPVTAPVNELEELLFECVENRRDSALWNELMERYHYLGYKPLPGAQLRYLVYSGPHLVAAMGFGAAAWKVAPRDRFIGWTAESRKKNLHLIVNNARFLILPWVTSRNLASKILGRVVRRLPKDWHDRYGYEPMLLETFVEKDRFQGTCYRAANWLHVGQTQGRGKLDTKHQRALPVKDVFLYCLDKEFRSNLCGE